MPRRSADWYIAEIARRKQDLVEARALLEEHESHCPGHCRTCNARNSDVANARRDIKCLVYAFQTECERSMSR